MTLGLDKLTEKYNAYLDPSAILTELEISAHPDPDNPNFLLAPCPLHKETNGSSLRIRKDNKTFVCGVEDCPGNKGGNVIRLYSMAREVSEEDACLQIFNIFGLATTDETRLLKRNLYIAFSEKLIAEDYLQAAKNALLAGFKEFPDNLVIISRLINIFTREGDKANLCDFLIKASRIVAKNRNYNSAKAALKRALTIDPDKQEAHDILAEIIVAEIADFYESSIESNGEDSLFASLEEISITPSLRVQLTEILLKHKRYKMIERLYSDLPDDLDDDQTSHLRAVIDKLGENIPSYENPAEYLLFLVDILLKMGDFETAKERLSEAKEALEESDPGLRSEEMERRLKKFEELLFKKEFENARVFIQNENYKEALNVLDKTLSSGRASAEPLNAIIQCHFKLGQMDEAHEKCLRLADFHESEGDSSQAALSLYHSLLFKPAHHETIQRLVRVLKSLERDDIAEQAEKLAARQNRFETKQIHREDVSISPPPPASRTREKILSPATPPPRAALELPESPVVDISPLKPAVSRETKDSENEEDFQTPITLTLYATGVSSDGLEPVKATTTSMTDSHLTVNCGEIQLPGIQPASINYILQNCRVMGSLSLPDHNAPIKIMGVITKVHNRRVSGAFHRTVTIDIQDIDESSRVLYEGFLRKLRKGGGARAPSPSIQSPPAVEKHPKSKGVKELLVSVRFLDEAGEEKCPDYYYANTMNIGRNNLSLNFGELNIPGVPAPSHNFFLENSVYELTIPLPENNRTVRLLGQAKKVKNKMISGKKNKIVEIEFTECHEQDRQAFQDYIQCFPSV